MCFNQKLRGSSLRARYEKRPLVNPAHPAGEKFRLWHWERCTSSSQRDASEAALPTNAKETALSVYPFARFNKRLETLRYTDEEYARYIASLPEQGSTTPWTKAETDVLFRLAEQFSLQFVVMADRWAAWNPTPSRTRSVNELKDRYYTVVRCLAQARIGSGTTPLPAPRSALQKHCRGMLANPFDKEYEDRRKAQLEEQCRRPQAELLHEEQVVKQAQEILRARRLRQRERRRLERLLGRPLPPSSSSPNSPSETVLPERLVSSAEEAPPLARATSWTSTAGTGAGAGMEPLKSALPRANDAVSETSAAVVSRRTRRALPAGVLVRSSLMLAPVTQSQRIQGRVDQILQELGVGIRPTPTAEICDEFDSLRQEILAWMELQRLVKRKEGELRAVQQRGSGAPSDRRSSGKRSGKRARPLG
ncbi:DNA methyltransferase 1-associated protein 1 [Cyanidiococcus yangmingshanensis]|uniref:DNA methyltransferase 1-associated protein 1 n=1 Tax=Cyanidiococcus yangmingshanensis TaxID=2690220 RepID=A0A7J7IHS5_9RHOD|nr:DNA methyltransferase 1-associated protein 1 [Cyanidiococcus yangmingshanensis]